MELNSEMVGLGKITRWLSGGTPSRSIAEYWVGDIPWISAFTLKNIEVSESDQCVTAEAVASGSKMAPVDSTLLLVRGSALHNEIRAGIVRKPVCFNQDVKALIPAKTVYPKYLTYSVLGRENELLKLVSSAGNTAGVLDTKLVQSFKIWLPKYDEQRVIATALSDVDALLDGLDRLIAKKRDLKQAAMQQLLTGKTRLPGFEGEWEAKKLGELLTICHGKSQREVEMIDGPFPILATGGKIGTASRPLYDKPSVLIGRKGTINQPQYMDRPFWTVDTLFYSIINGNNNAKFLYYRFLLIDWMQYNEASGVPSLNARTIESIEIRSPEPKEQAAIATVLSDMDAEIAALEQRRNKTKDIKQAIMQELLTGRTRLIQPQESNKLADSSSNNARGHNWAINEAVVIATLAKHFGKEDFPLGRKRYTKLSYLLHRHVERQVEGYRKKAAGPYNPQTKYGGPEKIAKQNGYIMQLKGPKGHSGFIAADNIAQAENYFEKWYGQEVIQWLEQFRFKTNDELEVLATVDMAAVELRTSRKNVDVAAVKDVIAGHPEWEAKLERDAFSDTNIAGAIKQIEALMEFENVGGPHA